MRHCVYWFVVEQGKPSERYTAKASLILKIKS